MAQTTPPGQDKTRTAIVLIHSPLVGPFTWEPVAAVLREKGIPTILPDLSGLQPGGEPFWQQAAGRVRAAVEAAKPQAPLGMVAHSGAGALLPAIRQALGRPIAGYLFADARLPKDGASFFSDAPTELADSLRSQEKGGWLPAWSEWFGEAAVAEILPDAAVRQRFLSELAPVPLAYLEEPTPVFSGWPEAACAYLQLSPAYEAEAAAAREMGWPVRVMEAGHLHMLVEPQVVAEALVELVQPWHKA